MRLASMSTEFRMLQRFAVSVIYLLLLSVRVIPWADTLKWTIVAAGRGLSAKVHLVALETASGPVRDSVSTEFR